MPSFSLSGVRIQGAATEVEWFDSVIVLAAGQNQFQECRARRESVAPDSTFAAIFRLLKTTDQKQVTSFRMPSRIWRGSAPP